MALSGTTSSVIAFGAVIKSEFTVCSVTRYTGGTKGKILQGSTNWLHGHYGGYEYMTYHRERAVHRRIRLSFWLVLELSKS